MIIRRAIAAVAAVVFASACASEQEIATTEAALDRLATQFEDRDDLASVDVSYDTTTGTPLLSNIVVSGRSTSSDRDDVESTVRDLAQHTWESDLPSVTSLSVRIQTAGGDGAADLSDAFGAISDLMDREQLEEEFGPRDR